MRHAPLIACLCAVLASPAARADRTDLTKAPPIRGELPYRVDRHQLTPVFGFTLADDYRRNLLAGITYRYFFTDWLGVGVDVMATYLSLETSLTEQITAEKSLPGQSGQPTTSSLGFLVGAGVTLVPISGKLMLLGSVPLSYDVHFLLGAGLGTTKMHSGSAGKIPEVTGFSPMVGIGARVFISSWIAVELEVRDYMLSMVKVARANVIVPDDTGLEFEQNFMGVLGVSFFFPPELERAL